jgi:hypothetical protein
MANEKQDDIGFYPPEIIEYNNQRYVKLSDIVADIITGDSYDPLTTEEIIDYMQGLRFSEEVPVQKIVNMNQFSMN